MSFIETAQFIPTQLRIDPQAEPKPVEQVLLEAYGHDMTYEQVSYELGLSPVYLRTKVGSAEHEHLPWVLPLRAARFKRGRNTFFSTQKVAELFGKAK